MFGRPTIALLIGAGTIALAGCSSSNQGLIPATYSSPLQNDFEAVAQDAKNGDGNCTETVAAIHQTEQDFAALPSSVAASLRNTLDTGIANLKTRALALCTQQLTTSTTSTTTTLTTTFTTTTTTETTTETTTSTTTASSSPGGGTVAPGTGESTPPTGESTPPGTGAGGAPAEGVK
jgi:hypothetical protein